MAFLIGHATWNPIECKNNFSTLSSARQEIGKDLSEWPLEQEGHLLLLREATNNELY